MPQQDDTRKQRDPDSDRKNMNDAATSDGPKAAAKPDAAESDPQRPSGGGLKRLGKDFLEDQKQIWTSPAQLRISDANWLVPVGGFAAGLFATDRD